MSSTSPIQRLPGCLEILEILGHVASFKRCATSSLERSMTRSNASLQKTRRPIEDTMPRNKIRQDDLVGRSHETH